VESERASGDEADLGVDLFDPGVRPNRRLRVMAQI